MVNFLYGLALLLIVIWALCVCFLLIIGLWGLMIWEIILFFAKDDFKERMELLLLRRNHAKLYEKIFNFLFFKGWHS
jgi:hypothetical protein